jgi:hypothetical protein
MVRRPSLRLQYLSIADLAQMPLLAVRHTPPDRVLLSWLVSFVAACVVNMLLVRLELHGSTQDAPCQPVPATRSGRSRSDLTGWCCDSRTLPRLRDCAGVRSALCSWWQM